MTPSVRSRTDFQSHCCPWQRCSPISDCFYFREPRTRGKGLSQAPFSRPGWTASCTHLPTIQPENQSRKLHQAWQVRPLDRFYA